MIRALPWFAERGDSAALHRAAAVLAASSDSSDIPRATYAREAVRGYVAIIRGDTAAGAAVLASLKPWCDRFACYQEQVAAARALARAGRLRAAAIVFDQLPVPLDRMMPPDFPLIVLEHARVRERLQEFDRAIPLYRYVTAAWRHADPVLQPYVRESREALARLAAGGGPASAGMPPGAPRPR